MVLTSLHAAQAPCRHARCTAAEVTARDYLQAGGRARCGFRLNGCLLLLDRAHAEIQERLEERLAADDTSSAPE